MSFDRVYPSPRRRTLHHLATLLAALPLVRLAGQSAPAQAADHQNAARSDGSAEAASSAAASDRSAPDDRAPVVLVVGDSLAAEYGISRGSGWVALLTERLATEWPEPATPRLFNASISGETTSGGQRRMAELLARHRPTLTVIELGANDALRGLSLEATRKNLDAMIGAAKAAGSAVVLVRIQVPPNFGAAFMKRFDELFTTLAATHELGEAPFLLEGFAEDTSWFQPDRIHPLARAQSRMLDNVWPAIERALRARPG